MTHSRLRQCLLLIAGLTLAAFAVPALAQSSTLQPSPTPAAQAPGDGGGDLENLLKILSEETAVATRTRMNGDYVPGIVTVLHAEELLSLGARTVWDALALVPGLETTRDPTGFPSVTVRGVQFPFNSGNVKVLVDSMPAVRDNAGINSMIFDMPLQIVDRIEVIRGPGSVVHGDFAYMGLVHIITRRSGRGVYARADEADSFSAGFFAGGRTKNGFELSLAGSGFSGKGSDAPFGRDVEDTRGFLLGSLRKGGFSLSADLVTRNLKDGKNIVPAVRGQQTHSTIEARYGRDFGTTRIEVRANARGNRFRSPPSDLDGDMREAGFSLHWKGAPRQSWLFDAAVTQSNIDSGVFPDPVTPGGPTAGPPAGSGPGPGLIPAPGPVGFRIANESLTFVSFMAQDTIDASDRLALTLGARFDHYSDVDTRVTPRASIVFRASERNIVKFQYAEGFRAPTFFELYSRNARATSLNFELNHTAEINFVHRRPGAVVRLTGFVSRLSPLIYVTALDATRHMIFGNSRKASAHGLEVEAERELSRKVKVTANASWVRGKDSRNLENIERNSLTVPDFTANIAVVAAPAPRVRVSGWWRFVGRRAELDLPGYHDLQGAVTVKNVGARGLDLRVGGRVSPGEGIIYPHILPTGVASIRYEFPKAFAELAWSR